MSRKKEASSQKKYIVSISRSFIYPSCVVNLNSSASDLIEKTRNDFIEEIADKGVDLTKFEINIESEIPYLPSVIVTDEERQFLKSKAKSSTFEYYIREITLQDMVDKYGPMDPIENPEIYVKYEEDIHNDDGEVVDTEIEYSLRDDVAEEWHKNYSRYLNILRNKSI